jgi:rfaE bifunctional protein kinase chain/domain
MKPDRLHFLTEKFPPLRIAVVGDICLDRYLIIDESKAEISIETELPVRNVVEVRSQPGGAGTIINNLLALGIANIFPVGFSGEDGEGFELRRALATHPGVRLDYFFETNLRRTFTYTKPLLVNPGKKPVELNRLDFKNWTPTPALVQGHILDAVLNLAPQVDALILLDQVDMSETGVVTRRLLEMIESVVKNHPNLLIVADSRRGLSGYPCVSLKMNRAEFAIFAGSRSPLQLGDIKDQAALLAKNFGKYVFVTLAEEGMVGAAPNGEVELVPALPLRGEIDIVGAGDTVTANLTVALAAGATLREALEIATAAASIVIHQLGTTGTATVSDIEKLLIKS